MWWAGSEPVDHLYLGTREVAWCNSAGLQHMSSVTGLNEGLAVIGKPLAAQSPRLRRRLRIWWSGGLCRPFLLEPPDNLASEEELLQLAAALAPKRSALNAPCRVWMDTAVEGKRLVVAVAESTWLACTEMTERAGWQIATAGPWWADALRIGLVGGPIDAISVRDCDSVTVLGGADDRFERATTYSPIVGDQDATSVMHRISAAPGTVGPALVQFDLRLAAPASMQPIDAMPFGAWVVKQP